MRAAKQTTCTLGATTTATYGRCNTVLHSRSSYHTKHAQSFVLRSAFASHRNKPLSSTRLQGNNTRLFVPSCAVQPQSHLRSKSSTPLSFTKSTLNSILQRSTSIFMEKESALNDFRTRRLSQKPLALETLRKLPKAELHLHLDGAVRISTILELAKEQHVVLPASTLEELTKLVTVDEKCNSLAEYLRGFDIIGKVLQKPYAITRVMYEVCQDAVADGVRYIEVRFSPILHTQGGMSLSQVMEAICEGKVMAEHNLPITPRIIVCGMRQLHPTETEKLAEIAWRYRDKGVVAFDLAGPESGHASKNHKSAFDIIHRNSINCTLHAGEAAGPESIQDSLRFCGAHRIGHGVALREDQDLRDFVIDRRIPIECCITSNIHTKAIKSAESHPIRQFFDAGVIVVPCTDNPSISNVTLSGEYLLYQRLFGFSIEELVRLIDYGFSSAFIPSTTKHRMRAEVLAKCVQILTDEGYDVSKITSGSNYWDNIGVDFSFMRSEGSPKGHARELTHSYWGIQVNPKVTPEIIKGMPKADLNCRLDGSVDVHLLWEELQRANIDIEGLIEVPCASLKDMKALVTPAALQDKKNEARAKALFNAVLQEKDQIRRAIQNIYDKGTENNVRYTELNVNLSAHTKNGLSEEEVLTVILDKQRELQLQNDKDKSNGKKQLGPRIGVVIYSNIEKDDPLVFHTLAQLAIKYKGQGVCGFAVLGDEEMKEADYKYYKTAFDNLKHANMNVSIFAGQTEASHILAAIHEGGATRISGAFQVHREPLLMDYIANHKIPVEMGLTDRFDIYTSDVRTFSGHPIRLYIDNNLPITICSFKQSLQAKDLNEVYYDLVKECNLSVSEFIQLLSNSFQYNFQKYDVRQEMTSEMWDTATTYLRSQGFNLFFKRQYFPQ